MGPEVRPNNPDGNGYGKLMHDLEAAANKIEGYYVVKLSKIDEEIEEIEAWPNNVNLGPTVKRKGQELLSLKRLRLDIQRSREHIVPMLAIIIKRYSDPKTPRDTENSE